MTSAEQIIAWAQAGVGQLSATEREHDKLAGTEEWLKGLLPERDRPHLARILDHSERLHEELVSEAPGIAEQLGMWERFARRPHGAPEERASLLRAAEREVQRLIGRIRWRQDQMVLLLSELEGLLDRAGLLHKGAA